MVMALPEFDLSRPVKEIQKLPVLAAVSFLDRIGVIGDFGNRVTEKLPSLVRIHGMTEAFKSRFLDLTSKGFLPEAFFGHFTHLDHIVMSEAGNELVNLAATAGYADKLHGFAVTLATSVKGGHQSHFMEIMYPTMQTYVNQRSVEFVEITRDEDEKRYGLKRKVSEKKTLVSKLDEGGYGVMVPAGGSVQPGRHPHYGNVDAIYGLQEITDNDLLKLFVEMKRRFRHNGYQPYFLPMAVIGTWRYFSVDCYLPTLEAIAVFYYGGRFSSIIDLSGITREYRIDITYGMPITEDDMVQNLGSKWTKYPQVVNIFLMSKVAEMLPEYAQGFYRGYVQK